MQEKLSLGGVKPDWTHMVVLRENRAAFAAGTWRCSLRHRQQLLHVPEARGAGCVCGEGGGGNLDEGLQAQGEEAAPQQAVHLRPRTPTALPPCSGHN